MKSFVLFITILFSSFVFADGQQPTPNPAEQAQERLRRQRESQEAFDRLRNSSNSSRMEIDRTQGLIITSKNPAYRRPAKDDLLLVAPNDEDTAEYADFLRQSKTGLIRLLSDEGCQENSNVVVAKDFCIKYKNVFGGSVYSFRKGTYVAGRFADIVYKNGTIYGIGKETLGIFTDLGENVSLADISANTNGAKYIFDFIPPASLPDIETFVAQLQKGIEINDFKYQRFYGLQENHTYLLRSVAYQKETQYERGQRIYDDLTNDERKDVIIALQVIRFGGTDKSDVTLLWKELQRKTAPKLRNDKDRK